MNNFLDTVFVLSNAPGGNLTLKLKGAELICGRHIMEGGAYLKLRGIISFPNRYTIVIFSLTYSRTTCFFHF